MREWIGGADFPVIVCDGAHLLRPALDLSGRVFSIDRGRLNWWPTLTHSHIAPVARHLLAVIFLMSGLQKLGDPAGTAAYIASGGLPGWLVWPTILVEVGAGRALVPGFQARLAALALAGLSLLVGVFYHLVPAFAAEGMAARMQMILVTKNASIAGGLLLVTAVSAGAWSLDNRRVRGALSTACRQCRPARRLGRHRARCPVRKSWQHPLWVLLGFSRSGSAPREGRNR